MSTSGSAGESSFRGKTLWDMLRAAVEKRRGADAAATATASEKLSTQKSPHKPADAFRETVESVVIAFVLAFLFRTFLAEAFVIPTGSMAPTLMGRHKDHRCTQCGHHYTIGASDEVEKEANILVARITTSVCPNCLYTNDVYDEPVFNGDRILVNKFPYEFSEPDRFDVFVFRYPEDPQTNYIKRLVGLPGESLKIERGDLYARKGHQGEFRILKKDDPNKQRLLQQTVYDDRHPPTALLQQGWPERWASLQKNSTESAGSTWSPSESGWQQNAEQRSFRVSSGAEWNWLRYRHFVPSEDDWGRADQDMPAGSAPQPQLIADFCGYNAHRGKNVMPFQQWEPELFWVGDLTLNARVDVAKLSGESPGVLLELVEGIRQYRCEFDLKTGTATLSRTDDLKGGEAFVTLATASNVLKGAGQHDVSFANVDNRLCLWVDNRLIPFGSDAEYLSPPLTDPQIADLHPVGIAARDADVTVSKLLLERDIYYRAIKSPRDHDAEGDVGRRLAGLLSDPAAYNHVYNQEQRWVDFDALDDDEFFAMGDNSSRSYDGRLWHKVPQTHHPHAVNRRALIGKAFFIYWPHGVPFLNDGKGFPIARHTIRNNTPVDNYPIYTAPFYPQWWRWSRIR